jgi:hypothetical protein
MKAAGRDVCNGLEIGVDVDQLLENGARYQDKRPMARAMWETMMRTLERVRAIPEESDYGQDRVRVQCGSPDDSRALWRPRVPKLPRS